MELYLFNSISVLIKDPHISSEDINLKSVLSKIESILPRQLSYGVDAIYIGEFDILLDRELNAAYNDGAIYVSNLQSGEDDLLDDIIHEFAHAFFWDKTEAEIYKFANTISRFLYSECGWRKTERSRKAQYRGK